MSRPAHSHTYKSIPRPCPLCVRVSCVSPGLGNLQPVRIGYAFMPTSSPSPVHLSKKLIARRPTGTPSGTARAAPGYSSVDGGMRRRQDPHKKEMRGDGYALVRKVVRYTECRKNHAASVGGFAVDGCREFMASGEEGTPSALKCAACSCHRSFHKREVEREVLCDCSSNSASPI